jgi:hypothetical protein
MKNTDGSHEHERTRTRANAPSSHSATTKELGEDVPHAAAAAAATTALEPLLPSPVVEGPLFLVFQHLICGADHLELLLGLWRVSTKASNELTEDDEGVKALKELLKIATAIFWENES